MFNHQELPLLQSLQNAITALRAARPLVLCLTNVVTMDFMANCLLALGASPLMSTEIEETEELMHIATALNVNIGTLNAPFLLHCRLATELAKKEAKPVILDPVGSGASALRTNTAQGLLADAAIVRGNASEIMALANQALTKKSLGVDSTQSVVAAKNAALILSRRFKNTVVISGREDFITADLRQKKLLFGSALMPLITGMGCSLTAVIAAFHAVIPDAFQAATLAVAYFGLCGNLAEKQAKKPGTFRAAFIDALYEADFKAMQEVNDAV